MLATETEQKVEELLVEQNLLPATQLHQLQAQAVKDGKSLSALIIAAKLVPEEDLTRVMAQASGLPYADLHNVAVDDSILKLLPQEVAKTNKMVPFGEMRGRLAVGMVDPANVQTIDYVARKIGRSLIPFMVSETSVQYVLGQYKADVSQEVSDVIDNVKTLAAEEGETVEDHKNDKKNKDLANIVQDAPITRALNTILEYAAQSRASDIHIEPREKEVKIRYRVDGILLETMTLPKPVEAALISRIKILSNLKIDEHRIPQDGQFQFTVAGREVDVRVSIAPIVYGEQVVIRLLDKDAAILTLDALGFKGRSLRVITDGINKPHGMTLSTGPTGSGKSTTLYAVIAKLKSPAVNIVTLEDPVEYKMDGINQMQVNPDVGLTFAAGLRSILRQDPNIVMVGEIRDDETADLAVQAALTGHVVLSTLHTNSAAGVLPRLLDMKVEPFLITSTVNTVIGQRLVRRVCDKCRVGYESTAAQTESIIKTLGTLLPKSTADAPAVSKELGYDNLPLNGQKAYTLYKGQGCPDCTNGYKGRIGIYEVFQMSADMERLLLNQASSDEIQAQAQKDGMITMKADGYLKALSGLTTIEEVARVASDY